VQPLQRYPPNKEEPYRLSILKTVATTMFLELLKLFYRMRGILLKTRI